MKKSGIKLYSLINIEIKVPDPKAYCAIIDFIAVFGKKFGRTVLFYL